MINNLLRNCIYQGKNYYRDKGACFWTLLYPLILGTFFFITLNGVLNFQIDNVNVGLSKGNGLEQLLENVDVVNIINVLDDEVNEKLNTGEIDGYIGSDFNLIVKESGIKQTVIKEIIEQIEQMKVLNKPLSSYDFSANYVKNSNQKANSFIIIFYSLIAMLSTYGIFGGIETVSLSQANLTHQGARIKASPLKTWDFLLAGIIISLLLNLISNGLLLLCITFVFKLVLLKDIKYSLLLIILGNLFGVSFGVLIGASSKKSSSIKNMMGICITLVLSFLSGMMNPEIKILMDRHVPMFRRINPIGIITNNLYKINLLDDHSNIMEGIGVLIALCMTLITISYFLLRRQTYDSL